MVDGYSFICLVSDVHCSIVMYIKESCILGSSLCHKLHHSITLLIYIYIFVRCSAGALAAAGIALDGNFDGSLCHMCCISLL